MSDTLARVIAIVADHSGVPRERLNAESAIDQDLRITGDDIDVLATVLTENFAVNARSWPWRRFANLSEYFWFKRDAKLERLKLCHIAAVIDRGIWFEP